MKASLTSLAGSSIFAKTARTLAAGQLFLVVALLVAVALLVVLPLGKRAADDFAALLWFSAQTWVELPPATRPDMEQALREDYGLEITVDHSDPIPVSRSRPYMLALVAALEARGAAAVRAGLSPVDPDQIWLDVGVGGHVIRFSFERARIGVHPPTVLAIALGCGALVALAFAALLSRRLAAPLEQLTGAVDAFANSQIKQTIDVAGPQEIGRLARHIESMQSDIERLIANRSVLLAGISHDLRTPLTRMQLALTMMTETAGEQKKIDRLLADVDQMTALLANTELLAQGIAGQAPLVETDVDGMLAGLAYRCKQQGVEIDLNQTGTTCCALLPEGVVERVVENLIWNAKRYGGDSPIEVSALCVGADLEIRVEDGGPGIPEEELDKVCEPFYRLEASRSLATGGSGLGLAIVKQLTDAYGWRFTLANRASGGLRATLGLGGVRSGTDDCP